MLKIHSYSFQTSIRHPKQQNIQYKYKEMKERQI